MFEAIRTNKIKTALIIASVTLFLMLVVYYVAYYTGFGAYAVPMAVFIAIISSWASYYYSDRIILSISGARPADKVTDKMVTDAMEGICIAAGLPMPKVYIIDDPSANAFATGRNPENAVVCVTTGLLKELDYYELEGVLAHELAHIGNRDMLLSTIVTVMVGIVVILSDIWTRTLFWGGMRRNSRRSNNGGGGAQIIIMALGLIFIILAPIAGQLMKLALSRNREYLADATAAEFTRNPEGLASALEKLGRQKTPVATATRATSNLYIVNPLKGEGISNLFSTHPPIEKRVQALRNLK